MQSEEDRIVMHVLHTKKGWPISRIAREFGVNWRTARRYATAEEPPRYGPRAKPAELTPAQLAHVRRRLEVCEAIRSTTLLRELRELGYEGSYPSLVRRVRELRGPSRTSVEALRFETDPGHQLQCDWADCGAWLVGERLTELYALVAVLGYSRMVAVLFATDKTRATTLRLLVEACALLGGLTEEVLTDRDPAFVIGSLPDGRAVLAAEWIDLADTLALTPRACKPRRPQTKGKVERIIREVKEDFLAWLTGQVLPARPTTDDYDTFARRWSVEVVANRRHRTTGRIVGEAWEQEQTVLRPVPHRILHAATGASPQVASGCLDPSEVDPAAVRAPQRPIRRANATDAPREAGSVVEQRSLAAYEEATS